MPPKRFSPDDPREWLNRARSSLIRSQKGANFQEIYLEDLCFDAQQAAEKAIKAVLIHMGVEFPYVHNIGELMEQVEKGGREVPSALKSAQELSGYAVESRYPGVFEPVTQAEYERAVSIAEDVVHWAEGIIERYEAI